MLRETFLQPEHFESSCHRSAPSGLMLIFCDAAGARSGLNNFQFICSSMQQVKKTTILNSRSCSAVSFQMVMNNPRNSIRVNFYFPSYLGNCLKCLERAEDDWQPPRVRGDVYFNSRWVFIFSCFPALYNLTVRTFRPIGLCMFCCWLTASSCPLAYSVLIKHDL